MLVTQWSSDCAAGTDSTQQSEAELTLVAIDTAGCITLIVRHTSVEWTVDRNLLIVWSKPVTVCVRI